SIVMFCFSWLVLSFNMVWKNKWQGQKIRNQLSTDIAINTGILILGVTALTILKQMFTPGFLGSGQLFFMTLFTYLLVQLILLLISRVVNLNFQHQQSLLEKEQAKQKALHHQLQALRTQINPHFLFNALNSLNALIRQKSENASTFVDKLSWLLRSTLQRSDKDFISLQDELEYLEAYIFLQKERFGEKFNVDVRIPEEWKKEMIPSFSLQLLVENAIKHNVASKQNPLLVEIYPKEGFLIVKNKIQERRDGLESTGTGLSNLSTRFQLLKKRTIQIQNDEQYFSVKLPVIENESSYN
ncbi:MAG: histidine kinase, partial [Saprospiraceae bacterium]|nr:histidine kinase [Saprospiraceae bacterium]